MRTRQLCKLDLRRTHSHSHSQTATAASMSRARCASCCTPAPPLAGRSALDPPPPPPPPLRPAGPSPAAARAALVTASAPAARSAYRRVSGATASETARAICSSVLLMCSALLCSAVFAFAFAGARVVHSDRSVAYANGVALRSLYRFIFSHRCRAACSDGSDELNCQKPESSAAPALGSGQDAARTQATSSSPPPTCPLGYVREQYCTGLPVYMCLCLRSTAEAHHRNFLHRKFDC